jgi:hypothetical protein
MKTKSPGPIAINGSKIAHIKHWLPVQVASLRTKSARAKYRWNEEPPAGGFTLLAQKDDDDFREGIAEIPRFSHGVVVLKNGATFNFWGARMVDGCPHLEDCTEACFENHAWFSDFTTDWDVLLGLLTSGMKKVTNESFERIAPRHFSNEVHLSAHKRKAAAKVV